MTKDHVSTEGSEPSGLAFERLITGLSARFINLPPAEIDRKILSALEATAEFLDLDTANLIALPTEQDEITSLYRYARPGLHDHPFVGWKLPWLAEKIRRGEWVVLDRMPDDLPIEAVYEREMAIRLSGKSALAIPLVVAGEVLGTLGYTCYRKYRHWSEGLLTRLHIAGEIFANALARKRADEVLRQTLDELRQLKDRLAAENVYLLDELAREQLLDEVVAHSPAMREVLFRVNQVAATDATVLLSGETGTGKGLIVKEIHRRSRRRDNPLVTVNCSALPASLIESELFGREKGSFTGAISQLGRFELADKGTLFLDEIGDLPSEIQPKLLRVLQEGEFERIGNPRSIKVDVRIIAATNHNLLDSIQRGQFRRDLFYRLNVFPIHVPPLRDHLDDLPPLIEHLVQRFCDKHRKPLMVVPESLYGTLRDYRWPGNVRELQNVVERMVITSSGPTLQLAEPLFSAREPERGREPAPPPSPSRNSLADVERNHIVTALEESNWILEGARGAAQKLGLNPSTLRGRMRKLGIRRPF